MSTELDVQSLRAEVAAQMARDPKVRIFRTTRGEAVYWVKLPRVHEKLRDWFRGKPEALMARELADLRALEALGQPVPRVVLEADGFFVIADNGIALDILWRERPEQRLQLITESARAGQGDPAARPARAARGCRPGLGARLSVHLRQGRSHRSVADHSRGAGRRMVALAATSPPPNSLVQ